MKTNTVSARPILTRRDVSIAWARHAAAQTAGRRLAWCRQAAGVTQRELGGYLGVSAATVRASNTASVLSAALSVSRPRGRSAPRFAALTAPAIALPAASTNGNGRRA